MQHIYVLRKVRIELLDPHRNLNGPFRQPAEGGAVIGQLTSASPHREGALPQAQMDQGADPWPPGIAWISDQHPHGPYANHPAELPEEQPDA